MGYDFKTIESKWQKKWKDADLYKTNLYDFSKPKFYIMDMFPYPSAQGLHVGHMEGYSATDALARFKRMQGYNVFHPMGFDSFGLPAEQFAIKNNTHPGPFTEKNIENFKKQMDMCGLSVDWSKTLETSNPKYYKWTQWIFEKLYEHNLAYEDYRPVNYCPELGTVLANEEVIDGKSERGGFPVITIDMKQWVLRITEYAQKLLDGLNDLDWPNSTITMQTNWIGKSEGVEIQFDVLDSNDSFVVYTTRVDTLFGCTYVVLAPEHSLVSKLTTSSQKEQVEKYLEQVKSKSEIERTNASKEKTGVFLGSYAINPINNKKVPIYIGDYVLASYGSGAVMAVPCHDQRDYEFAKKNNIEMIQVLEGDVSTCAMVDDAKHINSSFADGLNIQEAKKVITDKLIELNKGKKVVHYKLRDWLFSRQRYWGEPIPIIHMEDGSLKEVPYNELPLELPELDNYAPSGDGKPPLSKAKDWVNVTIDGKKGVRETNIMPQWAGSSWYFIRYLDPNNETCLADPKLIEHWLPVDVYIGGAEHAVLHLLYARFWHKFLYDLGIVKTPEPFKKLRHPGMILGPDGQKMSKSRGNVINPNDCVNNYGADSFRLYELFKGPLDQSLPWSDNGLNGANRFLNRVYRLFTDVNYSSLISETNDHSLDEIVHQTIKKVTLDYDNLAFNTAISAIMILVNNMYQAKSLYKQHMKVLTQLLEPVAPHLAQECYQILGYEGFIDFVSWPKYDEKLATKQKVTIAISINGKRRGEISLDKGYNSQDELIKQISEMKEVNKYLIDKTIVKVIFVVDKIINIVVK